MKLKSLITTMKKRKKMIIKLEITKKIKKMTKVKKRVRQDQNKSEFIFVLH